MLLRFATEHALIAWFTPAAIALFMGIVFRRLRPAKSGYVARAVVIFAALAIGLAAATVATLQWRLVYWDGAVIAVSIPIAFALGANLRDSWREIALGLSSIAVGLIALELGTRTLLGTPPAFAAPQRVSWQVPRDTEPGPGQRSWQYDACELLYPGTYPEAFESRWRREPSQAQARVTPALHFSVAGAAPSRTFLHVGDSMTMGNSVVLGRTFVAELERRLPGTSHLNGGMLSTSTDYALTLVRHWLQVLPDVQVVVLHVFLANDFLELDQPMPCCEDGPLLSGGPSNTNDHCPSPESRSNPENDSLRARIAASPPPLPLRALRAYSSLARYLSAFLVEKQPAARSPQMPATTLARRSQDESWARFREILTTLRDELKARDVSLLVDIVPFRGALLAEQPEQHPIYRDGLQAIGICRELGIPAMDPFNHLLRRVHEQDPETLFVHSLPDDPHFSVTGHRAMAEYLAAHPEIVRAASPPAR